MCLTFNKDINYGDVWTGVVLATPSSAWRATSLSLGASGIKAQPGVCRTCAPVPGLNRPRSDCFSSWNTV